MTKEEYIKRNQMEKYFFTNKYSEPKYDCPKCEKGHMRKDLSMIFASNPPMFQYECDICGYTDYLNF